MPGVLLSHGAVGRKHSTDTQQRQRSQYTISISCFSRQSQRGTVRTTFSLALLICLGTIDFQGSASTTDNPVCRKEEYQEPKETLKAMLPCLVLHSDSSRPLRQSQYRRCSTLPPPASWAALRLHGDLGVSSSDHVLDQRSCSLLLLRTNGALSNCCHLKDRYFSLETSYGLSASPAPSSPSSVSTFPTKHMNILGF